MGNILQSKDGELCYEPISKRFFFSTIKAINESSKKIDTEIKHGKRVSLNDYYQYLGLDRTPIGDSIGWDKNNPLVLDLAWIQTKDYDQLALMVGHKNLPRF